MRRGTFLFAAAGIAAILGTASASSAATPRQIYADLAQHGKLTHRYSAADLERAARDATLQGYGGVGNQATRPVVQHAAAAQAAATQGAATQRAQLGATQSSGSLPFTGLQLGVYAALGLAVLVAGLLLRRAGRRDTGA